MSRQPKNRRGIRLRKRYGRLREHLFAFVFNFVADPAVRYTPNGSVRDLRTSVVFCKVTNGFRSVSGADLFAAVRSVVDTGRGHSLSPFDAIPKTRADQLILPAPVG